MQSFYQLSQNQNKKQFVKGRTKMPSIARLLQSLRIPRRRLGETSRWWRSRARVARACATAPPLCVDGWMDGEKKKKKKKGEPWDQEENNIILKIIFAPRFFLF
jgi:hypothetical protein